MLALFSPDFFYFFLPDGAVKGLTCCGGVGSGGVAGSGGRGGGGGRGLRRQRN